MIERMYEIKNMTYECVYSPQVVERIKELVETDYPVENCLDFIDSYGEQDFFNYYDLFVDFELDFKSIDTGVLIDFYSGFSFLDLEFMGEYSDEKSFIRKYYNELDILPPVISIDWEETIQQVKKFFDFVPSKKQTFYIFCK